ncbi:MAG: hypothetical protein GXP42_19110 [Chloroflexi bacterium]|nr:hypothetical protein [Chloroflexota bacterium]
MTETKDMDVPQEDLEEIPKGQQRFDNVYLLLILSLIIPFLMYNLWGMIEIASLPNFVP